MKALYEELKELRLEKGVSLKEIAEHTKIRIELLEKLEEDDLSSVPAPYIRAFYRGYAHAIDVSPELVMAKLDKKVTTILPETQPEIVKIPADSKDEFVQTDESPQEIEPPQAKGTPLLDEAPLPEEILTESASDSSEQPPEQSSDTSDTIPEEATVPAISDKPHESPQNPLEAHVDDSSKDTVQEEIAPEDAYVKDDTVTDANQMSLFEGRSKAKRKTKRKSKANNETEVVRAEISPPEEVMPKQVTPRAPLDIKDPDTSNPLFFIMFFVLIVLAGLAIFMMNRG